MSLPLSSRLLPRLSREQYWRVFLFTLICAASTVAQEPAAQTNQTESKMITGRVVNESGQPLPGANVSAGTFSGGPGQRTSTDNEGYFKLQAIDTGLYRLFVSLPGYVPYNYLADPGTAGQAYRAGDSASITLIKGGVISGIITNTDGDPVVNLTVRAFRIRDAEGNKVGVPANLQPRMTDDRGYYRIYGVQPGTYVVAAGGFGQYFGGVNPFANDAMTFAPSSTRDTAVELLVRSDQEVSADIRYRSEPGHSISGKVSGAVPQAPFNIGVRLTDVESHIMLTSAAVSAEERTFQLNGVSDGEYEVSAIGGGAMNSELIASPGRRVSVKGADVTGIELVVAPMGSIAGRVILEPDAKLNCGRRRDTALRETLVTTRRGPAEEKPGVQKSKDKMDESIETSLFPPTTDSSPNEAGEINLRNLPPANYRFEIRAPGAGWYVRDVSSQKTGRPSLVNIPKNGIALKAGEKVSDLTIAIAEGGAGLRGRVTAGEGQSLPSGLRLYLAPAERENSENVLRFFEGAVAADGTFAIGNLAPGRYWIVAQLPEPVDSNTMKSIKSDSAFRTKIIRDAETLKKEIAFKPCERTVD
ncbi:MAG: carboxypeptidase regulatory-like domain-containing protein, partial [Pyrinomonadaceae bacterium]